MTAPEGYRAVLLKVNKFKQISHTHGPRLKNYFQIFKFHWKWPNNRHLRPFGPQTASNFEVKNQVRVGKINQVLLKHVCKHY